MSFLRPSSLSRTMRCTASIALIERLTARGIVSEDDDVERWTAEGSVAHLIRQECLELGMDPSDFVGQVVLCDGHKIAVDEEMAEALYPGLDWIRERAAKMHVEESVDIGRWVPGQKGTADCWFVWDTPTGEHWLVLSDLKYGMKGVEAHGSEQQMAYGLGLLDMLGWPDDLHGLLVNIDQPRAFSPRESLGGEFQDVGEDDPGRGMKFWKCTLDELRAFGERLRLTHNDIATGRTFFAPSDAACTYCPARAARTEHDYLGCAAYNRWMALELEAATGGADDEDYRLPGGEEFTAEFRYQLVRRRAAITKWLKELEAASLESALAGRPDPGSKVVMVSGGGRTYASERRAEIVLRSALGDDARKPGALIGITEAQKRMKPGRTKKGHPREWALLERMLVVPLRKPGLAPIEDKRSGVDMSVFALDDLED